MDHSILSWINQFAGRSGALDYQIRFVSNSDVYKGLPLMMLFWGLWFSGTRIRPDVRPILAALLAAMIASIALGRALALLLPFRMRPLYAPDIDINVPIGMPGTMLESWSSMPSDHAVFFFALAFGFLCVNRLAGLLALLHAILVVSLPRVYLGLHFPSDILAGAVVGSLVSLVLVPPLARILAKRCIIERVLSGYSFVFYPVMFFVTFQAASMFNSLRSFLSNASRLIRAALT